MSTTNNPYMGMTLEELMKNTPPWNRRKGPKPKPALTLAASDGRKPDEEVASVALEPEDVDRVRDALAHRRVRIGDDVVGFDKVTEARVTMRWTRCMPVEPANRVASGYDPFAPERMPGYRGDDQ